MITLVCWLAFTIIITDMFVMLIVSLTCALEQRFRQENVKNRR